MNVSSGEKEDRMMITGLHTVADIFCVGCGSIVGWKYVSVVMFMHLYCFCAVLRYMNSFFQEIAHEKSQKYKEGKSVLEL